MADMAKMMTHTAKFVREGGKYLIADVSRSRGNLLAQAFNIFYLKLGMSTYWLMGMVPWHENYDYPAFFDEAGLTYEHTEYFRFAKKGPILFQSIVAKRI